MTDAVQKIAESYECKPIEGMLSHQLEQNIIDGAKTIIQNPSEAQRKEHDKYDFELHEVYAIDVLISTGEGQGREKDTKITIYKKTDETYMLKMKNSREFFSNVTKKFGTMPFTLRALDSETKAKMGVVECVTHKLVEPFQVLYEKEGEYVAQFKFTVLLMPNGPHKITGIPFDPELAQSEKKIEDLDIQVRTGGVHISNYLRYSQDDDFYSRVWFQSPDRSDLKGAYQASTTVIVTLILFKFEMSTDYVL